MAETTLSAKLCVSACVFVGLLMFLEGLEYTNRNFWQVGGGGRAGIVLALVETADGLTCTFDPESEYLCKSNQT